MTVEVKMGFANLKKSKYSYVIIFSESFNILACMLTVDMTERKTAFKLLCLVLYKYMNDDLFWENKKKDFLHHKVVLSFDMSWWFKLKRSEVQTLRAVSDWLCERSTDLTSCLFELGARSSNPIC